MVIALGLYAFIGGLISFLGWPADLPRLTDWDNDGIAIQPNAAVAVTLTGAALLFLAARRARVSAVLGVVVAFVGFSTLVQYATNTDFAWLNRLFLFGRDWGRVGVTFPGRMGPPGAMCWTLIGAALILASRPSPRARAFVSRLSLVTLAIATLSIAGYFYGVDRLYTMPYATIIALQTATFILATSIGLIAAVPEQAPARWLVDTGATGEVARRAIPLVIFFPFIAGWLRLWGERSGYYDANFGTAMLVLVLVATLLALLSWTLGTISASESALRKSERRVTSALESITDGFVTLDREWRYRFVNPEAAKMLQRTPSELIGKSAWELFPESVGGTSFQELHRAATERVTVEYEDYNPVLKRWFENRAYATSDGALVIYFKDVTPQKLADAERDADHAGVTRLQVLSTQLVQSGDMHTLLCEILAAATELTGTDKGNIQLCDADSGQLRIVEQMGFSEPFLEYYATGGTPFGCGRAAQRVERVIVEDVEADENWKRTEDLKVLRAEGVRSFQSTPLVTRDGRLIGVLNTHFTMPHRITEREARHLDLLARMAADFVERAQSETALMRADRQKDEFLAMLAHELRNPLAPILNGVRVLSLTSNEDRIVVSTAQMLERQVGQLVRLVDDLVDVNRITRGKIELSRQPVVLSVVINQAVEAARPLVLRKEQVLDVELPEEPIPVEGDFTRLTQVVGNILNNASKFTPHNGRIVVTVKREGDYAEIRVRDTGLGMTPENLPRIFDLFMQGDTALERTTSGLGIGLTLVKTLVEMHGGTVEARSDGPGTGSEFVVQLPVLARAVAKSLPLRPPATSGSPVQRRILVVDDNKDGAASLAEVLTLSGHATAVAYDGEEAIATAERFQPDIVLLDIGLPKLNGYDTCRRIREQPWGRDILIVAVTGWGQEKYRERSTEAGFDRHVVKPVDSDTLLLLLQDQSQAIVEPK